MDVVQNLVDEVRWRYKIGSIDEIDIDTVTEVAESIYPKYNDPKVCDFITQMELGDLVYEALMRI